MRKRSRRTQKGQIFKKMKTASKNRDINKKRIWEMKHDYTGKQK